MSNTFDWAGFDYENAIDEKGYQLIPDGSQLRVMIDDAEYKKSNNGKGYVLHLKMHVTDKGDYYNWTLRDWIVLVHVNQMAAEIGCRKLGALCRSIGFTGPLDGYQDVVGHEATAVIGIEKGEYQGEERTNNKIKRYVGPKTEKKGMHESAVGKSSQKLRAEESRAKEEAPHPADEVTDDGLPF